jgi:hypothetical protein
MPVSKKRLFIMLTMLFCLVAVCLVGAEARRFFAARSLIMRYQGLLETQPDIDPAYLTELRSLAKSLRDNEMAKPEPAPAPTLADTIATVRAALLDNGIVVERFQVSGKGQSEAAEFVLRTQPLLFFRFLEQAEAGAAFSVTTMNIRGSGAGDIEVNMKVSHAE